MTDLYLLEPADPGAAWAPFTGVRPLAELRAGIWRIRERWEGLLGLDCTAILGDHVAGFIEGDAPRVMAPAAITGPAVVAAAWFAPTGEPVATDQDTRRLVHDGATVAWIVPEGATWAGPDDAAGGAAEVAGLPLHGSYDLLTALEHFLSGDCSDILAEAQPDDIPLGSIVLGDPHDVVCLGAQVEPGVLFDVRRGPVVLEEGAEVHHGARLEGPLYIGAGSIVLGGSVRTSVVGPQCRLGGEVATSVFLGFANKVHDGFVGHSVVGHWVNLGAGTTTSNLKNTYGPVRLEVAGQRLETGRQFLGSLIGDHAKTAIGTMLPTGTVIGAGANLFGAQAVPKAVAPFAWGNAGTERLTEEGFLRVAERVLPRRGVEWSPEQAETLAQMYRRQVAR